MLSVALWELAGVYIAVFAKPRRNCFGLDAEALSRSFLSRVTSRSGHAIVSRKDGELIWALQSTHISDRT